MSTRLKFQTLINAITKSQKRLSYELIFVGCTALAVSTLLRADESLSAQEIRQLSQQGQIKPLLQILQQHTFEGTLLDVELEREHGRLIYELEFLNAQGEVWEYELDAATGLLLSRELEESAVEQRVKGGH